MHTMLSFFANALQRTIFRKSNENDSTTAKQDLDTTITKVRLVRAKSLKEGKRTWDVEICHDNGANSVVPLSLEDPFEAREYPENFKFFADDSFEPTKHNRSEEQNRQLLGAAELRIPRYGDELLTRLELDNPAQQKKNREIVVIEDFALHNEDQRSLHNLVWELLEDPKHWKQTKPHRVNVTRVISSPIPKEETEDPKGTPTSTLNISSNDHSQKPLRMLLVIGRSLLKEPRSQSDWVYKKERVSPSLIQHSIMQTMRHLEEIGHHRKLQLEILRPATFVELQAYLGLNTSQPEDFDIIHLDMHGEMRAPLLDPCGIPRPHLAFTEVPMGPPAYILASEVAQALRQRTKLLVMNACNSSSLSGELGIRMVRTFLQEAMGAISATSYRLQETAAEIYYPVFYMSLLLNGSFNRAAAEARQALRMNPKRHGGENRDDHYVHWNWSSTPNLIADVAPVRSPLLHFKMLLELLPRLFFWIVTHVCMSQKRKQAWKTNHTYDYPMYAMHRQFEKLDSHVRCAEQLDIPSITLYTLELEYWLKNSEKHSVYLHPQHFNSDPGLQSIRSLVRNTVRIWVETNFVSEVRILDVKKMLEGASKPWSKPHRFWRDKSYRASLAEADWSWRQCSGVQTRKLHDIKSMLIIDGFEALAIQNHPRKEAVLKELSNIAQEMKAASGDMYVVTIGGLLEAGWLDAKDGFALRVLGHKWAGAQVLKLPLRTNFVVSTFSRKVRRPEPPEDDTTV